MLRTLIVVALNFNQGKLKMMALHCSTMKWSPPVNAGRAAGSSHRSMYVKAAAIVTSSDVRFRYAE